MTKYLTEQEIENIIGTFKFDNFATVSTDSYNETMVAARIAKSPRPDELLFCAINFAVVGYGNKRFGNYKFKDVIQPIAEILTKNNVKMDNQRGAVLAENDLTPQRLCRFFRYNIRNYLKETGHQTYLFRKYSTRIQEFSIICFRGAEYLDDLTEGQAAFLLDAVISLDNVMNSTINERIRRVFEIGRAHV